MTIKRNPKQKHPASTEIAPSQIGSSSLIVGVGRHSFKSSEGRKSLGHAIFKTDLFSLAIGHHITLQVLCTIQNLPYIQTLWKKKAAVLQGDS